MMREKCLFPQMQAQRENWVS